MGVRTFLPYNSADIPCPFWPEQIFPLSVLKTDRGNIWLYLGTGYTIIITNILYFIPVLGVPTNGMWMNELDMLAMQHQSGAAPRETPQVVRTR